MKKDQISLLDRLENVNWTYKHERYEPLFDYAEDINKIEAPKISVIVISHRIHPDTEECLKILYEENQYDAEIIFVSNGIERENCLLFFPFLHKFIKLNQNTGAYIARNIGSIYANAKIISFIEDDCTPVEGLLNHHLDAYSKHNCISVRGVYEPKTENPLNFYAGHYSMGNEVIPSFALLEGNASYLASCFFKVGGWDDDIWFGGAGTELGVRLLEVEPNMRKQIYYPKAKILHDYANDKKHFEKKRALQVESFKRLYQNNPDFRLVKLLYSRYLLNPKLDLEKFSSALPKRFAALLDASKSPNIPKQRAYSISVIIWARSLQEMQQRKFEYEKMNRNDIEFLFVAGFKMPAEIVKSGFQIYTLANSSKYDLLNLGAAVASSNLILFWNTGTVNLTKAIEAHLRIHDQFDIISVQGKVIEQRKNGQGLNAAHEYYPEQNFPAFTNYQVNTSFRKNIFLATGGWQEKDSEIAGVIVGSKILEFESDFRKQIYSPEPVAIHQVEYSVDIIKEQFNNTDLFVKYHPTLKHLVALLELAKCLFGKTRFVQPKSDLHTRKGLTLFNKFLLEDDFVVAKKLLCKIICLYPELPISDVQLHFSRYFDFKKILDELKNENPVLINSPENFQKYLIEEPTWFSYKYGKVSNASLYSSFYIDSKSENHPVILKKVNP
jgi:GT2 family glycosyltransferase